MRPVLGLFEIALSKFNNKEKRTKEEGKKRRQTQRALQRPHQRTFPRRSHMQRRGETRGFKWNGEKEAVEMETNGDVQWRPGHDWNGETRSRMDWRKGSKFEFSNADSNAVEVLVGGEVLPPLHPPTAGFCEIL